jgi:uncharacterized protein
MTAADLERVLELNEESVKALSPLDADGVDWHRRNTAAAVVWDAGDEIEAFAFAFGPGSTYQSVNYRWHAERFADFLYLDRIAVSPRLRRQGIASALYDAIEAQAASHGRMVCEVYCDPPNEESLAFHERRGYREIGFLTQPNGHQSVMLEKRL